MLPGSHVLEWIWTTLSSSSKSKSNPQQPQQDDGSTQVVTVDDIQPPQLPDDDVQLRHPVVSTLKTTLFECIHHYARQFLTNMYKDMGESMGGLQGGGEFLQAINSAKAGPKCRRLVLGDRDSLLTIRRAAELALRSGHPFRVLQRLNTVSEEEMGRLEQQVREQQQDMDDDGATTRISDGELQVAVIEALKSDPDTRQRLFGRLELEVPEFARAFLTERDYIMAEAIRRECSGSQGAVHVVAVVGLAHVPGMAKNLQQEEKAAAGKEEQQARHLLADC
jgi:pheromone shutdown protein TraB